MLTDLTVGVAGSLIASSLEAGFKKLINIPKEKKTADAEEKLNRIQLLNQLMSARNTLQYFSEYYNEFLDGNFDDGAEESLFRSLLFDNKERMENSDKFEDLEYLSSYCLSIFELYESIESALYATNVFWDEDYFETKEIIAQFDRVRNLKVNFDLGNELEHEILFEISHDLLNIHNVIESLLNLLYN